MKMIVLGKLKHLRLWESYCFIFQKFIYCCHINFLNVLHVRIFPGLLRESRVVLIPFLPFIWEDFPDSPFPSTLQ